ncbi:4885_t:CDS:2 [Paraglomus occultum]|uniref:4885_t:CDS:1 n=1 Tax=Paraglomus occultum TaxID=144539 RepID=A0A9N9CHS0_9GLOM|nr:4885_t:CDS:2 [Paraglomus occultum]
MSRTQYRIQCPKYKDLLLKLTLLQQSLYFRALHSNDQNGANGNGDTSNAGNTTKTLIIAGAVVAGVIVVGGLFMVVYRFRKTREDWDEDGEIDLRGDSAWEYSLDYDG